MRLEGNGLGVECISLNLIILGKYAGTGDIASANSLLEIIGSDVQKYYEICVDSQYVSYAEDHPLFENKISSEEFYVASFDEDFSALARWAEKRISKALDIFLD